MTTEPFTLALDCTAIQGSVALLKDNSVISERTWVRGQSHAELVIPAIDETLKAANLKVKDLSLLVVCSGPGSFTGVRVGINVIKSFCYSFQIPVVSITSLELWSENFLAPNQKGITALASHDGSFFYSLCEKDSRGFLKCSVVKRATTAEMEEFKKNSSPENQVIIATTDRPWPKAEVLAKIAIREASLRKTKDWKAVTPLYVRASSAEEKIGKA